MNYLFIDASENATHAQTGNDSGFNFRTFSTNRNLAARITEITDQMLHEAAMEFNDIGLLVVCTGPGSLTGLRVAAGFFRTLATLARIPLTGINLFEWALESLAEQGHTGEVNLALPTLIDKAFVATGHIEKRTVNNPILVERRQPGNDTYAIRGLIPGMKNLDLTPSSLDRLIKKRCNDKTFSFSEMLEVLPMYIIPSQAERKLEEKNAHTGN